MHLAQLCGVKFLLEILSDKIACCKVSFCKHFGLHRKRALHSTGCRVLLICGVAIEIAI